MAEVSPSVVALARLRASRTIPLPEASATMRSWHAAAVRAGRRLHVVSRPGQLPELALGWVDGSEPFAGPDAGIERRKPSLVLTLTFAAALRACWQDRSEHPYPGSPTTEQEVLAAVASLGPLSRGALEGGDGAEHHQKGALRRLHAAGYLVMDGQSVVLGTKVALWSDIQVSALQVIYDQLPVSASRGAT